MENTKKSFGQIWSELTSEQAEYLRNYINKQRQDAVKEYKEQQLRLHGVVKSSYCLDENIKGSEHKCLIQCKSCKKRMKQ